MNSIKVEKSKRKEGYLMVAKIEGVRNVQFTSREGREINGVTVYISFENENVAGRETDKVFLSADRFQVESLTPGTTIDLSFSRRGKVETFEIV